MRVVFFGTPDFAVPTLLNLLDRSEFEVLAVVTQPDKRRRRGNKVTPSPVKEVACDRNLPVLQPQKIKKDPEVLEQLRQFEADVFVVVAYGQILSQEILDIPSQACINVHGSILPKYRGAAPIQWSLYNGEPQTGITTMLMDAGMDTGAMLMKATTPIGLLDNTQDLAQKLATSGADLLVETLLKLEKKEIQAIDQNDSEATYAPLIKKEDYQLDWSVGALQLHNQIRAFYPNCNTIFREQPLKVTATIPFCTNFDGEIPSEMEEIQQKLPKLPEVSPKPGEVFSIIKGKGPVVQTGDGLLLLRQVQLPGKRPQSGWDFVNGFRLKVGEILGLNS